MAIPRKALAYTFDVAVVDSNNRPQFRSSATIAEGDWKIFKDDSAAADLGTLPAVTPASSKNIKVVLSATEMDASRIRVIGSDQTNPPEWDDVFIEIVTEDVAVIKNKALTNFEFIMRDSTTHLPVTGKTVTCTRSIDGAAFGAGSLANTAEVANGVYKVDFAAADLNGDTVMLRATATGCDDTFVELFPEE